MRAIAVRRTASLRSAYDPRIHVFLSAQQDVDGRVKPGHDDGEVLALNSLSPVIPGRRACGEPGIFSSIDEIPDRRRKRVDARL